MNNMKKLLCVLLVLTMVFSMAACNTTPGEQTTAPTNKPSDSTGTATYNVSIQSAGKLPLGGIDVQIYEDDTKTNLLQVGRTNEKGVATINMAPSDKYAIVLNNVPDGYQMEASYKFAGNTANITLTSKLIEDQSLAGKTFNLGDVMYDFEFTDTDGNIQKLSKILEEKEMVLLNLFFTTCGPCASEMPYMEQAYQMYKDKAEILAISPYGQDTQPLVKAFKERYGLSFPMGKVNNAWSSMAVNGSFPTTYIIDRYGVITLIEVGGMPSLRPFTSIFEFFTGDDYVQTLCSGGVADVVKDIPPQFEDETVEDLAATLGSADGNVAYRNEVESEMTWPFIRTEKDGVSCVKASNSGYEATHSIIYVDVTLKKGQALAFDYLLSTEANNDVMHVILNRETPIFTMSGKDEVDTWKTAYPWVATQDGTYEIGITYIKDDSDNVGDDTVYLKNFRIVDSNEIDVPTFLPSEAATTEDDFNYTYVDVVLNEEDGYYHVGTKDGPYLLANLLGVTQFAPDNAVYLMALEGKFVKDGVDYTPDLVPYASYAANSKLSNYCTVTEELAELLKLFVDINGFEDNENEWLKVCRYYAAYGTNGAQLEDPILGLATFSAIPGQEGMNSIPYDGTPIMPRGKLVKFVPSKSGVYCIESFDTIERQFLSAFIFDDSKYHHSKDDVKPTYEHEAHLRDYFDTANVKMYYYMEAGRAYYVDICYWDPYQAGEIPFSITYVAKSMDLLRLASPTFFTYDGDETGDTIYEIIHGGIDAVLNPADGYYYHDLGKDENGNQIYGSKIYADFTGYAFFNMPMVDYYDADGNLYSGLISNGAFDFSKSEYDMDLDRFMKKAEGDADALRELLRIEWGDEYDYFYNEWKVEEYLEGKYHGTVIDANGNRVPGTDDTEAIKAYVAKMIKTGELEGCVAVDAELAELLQRLMDKYSFSGVYQSWLKLCYYYEHLGA